MIEVQLNDRHTLMQLPQTKLAKFSIFTKFPIYCSRSLLIFTFKPSFFIFEKLAHF